ncbi:MAG TPA: FkbM family methyltransferase [Acidimicrobiia bacterium]|jgi:FkbM family methyltransferase
MSIAGHLRAIRELAADPKTLGMAGRLALRLREHRPWYAGTWFAAQITEPEERRAFALGLLADDGMVLTFERDGITWTADIDSTEICLGLVTKGSYQGEEFSAVLDWVRANRGSRSTIIDVGANIGTTSIPFAQAGYSVLAIEAVPSTFELLCTNVSRNNLEEQVRCVPVAVSQDDTVTMLLAGPSGVSESLGSGSPERTSEGRAVIERVDVPGEGLASIVDRHQLAPESIALVWSDTQGGETGVIRTGADIWRSVPLYAEFWPEGLEAHGGLDDFVDEASRWFSSFVTVAAMSTPRPVRELHDLAGKLKTDGTNTTDVLLVP